MAGRRKQFFSEEKNQKTSVPAAASSAVGSSTLQPAIPGSHMTFEIRCDDLSGEATRSLLALHLLGMHESSPPCSVFALDLSGLQTLEVTLWTARQGSSIAGIGALKNLGNDSGELKSMRTHPDFLRSAFNHFLHLAL